MLRLEGGKVALESDGITIVGPNFRVMSFGRGHNAELALATANAYLEKVETDEEIYWISFCTNLFNDTLTINNGEYYMENGRWSFKCYDHHKDGDLNFYHEITVQWFESFKDAHAKKMEVLRAKANR